MGDKEQMEKKEQGAKTPLLTKKMAVTLGVLVVLILIVGYIFLKEEPKANEKPKEESEQAFKEKTGYDERLRKIIQDDFYLNNQGDIYEGYRYNDRYYLTVNQSGVFAYNDDYPGDRLLWVKEKDGKVETQAISSGDKLLKLLEEDGSPYFEQEGHTYFIYIEKEGNETIGSETNGFVYEVKKDGKVEKQYETKGHFVALKKDENRQMVLVEKVFTDTRNQFPMEKKPYKLKFYRLEQNEWVFLQEELVDPTAEEQMDEKR